MWYIPRKLWQNNLSSISCSGFENRIIITLSYKSELMFNPVNDFLIVITKPKDVFQRDSEWKCAIWVGLSNNIFLSGYKTIILIISSNWSVCAWIFTPQLVQTCAFLKIIWKFQQPSIVVACPGWNRLSTSCPESWYFMLLNRCIIALFVSGMMSTLAHQRFSPTYRRKPDNFHSDVWTSLAFQYVS